MRVIIGTLGVVGVLALGCGREQAQEAPPAEAPAAADGERVVYDIGADDLNVARLVLDLREVVVRFTESAHVLPLDRVQIFGTGPAPEDLDAVLDYCSELLGRDVTGGESFMIGQGEGTVLDACGGCAPCGFTTVCASACRAAGAGRSPDGRGSDEPEEAGGTLPGGGSGGSTGGGSSSGDGRGGGSGSGSSSGAGSGGHGGSHGGVGNPGDP